MSASMPPKFGIGFSFSQFDLQTVDFAIEIIMHLTEGEIELMQFGTMNIRALIYSDCFISPPCIIISRRVILEVKKIIIHEVNISIQITGWNYGLGEDGGLEGRRRRLGSNPPCIDAEFRIGIFVMQKIAMIQV